MIGTWSGDAALRDWVWHYLYVDKEQKKTAFSLFSHYNKHRQFLLAQELIEISYRQAAASYWTPAKWPLIQYWHYLPGDSFRPYNLGVSILRTLPPLQRVCGGDSLQAPGCFTCASNWSDINKGFHNPLLCFNYFAQAAHRTQGNTYFHFPLYYKKYYKGSDEKMHRDRMGEGMWIFHAPCTMRHSQETQRTRFFVCLQKLHCLSNANTLSGETQPCSACSDSSWSLWAAFHLNDIPLDWLFVSLISALRNPSPTLL